MMLFCPQVVGSHPALGEWSVQNGLSLEWSEGDVWMAEVTLPPGTHEFKVPPKLPAKALLILRDIYQAWKWRED